MVSQQVSPFEMNKIYWDSNDYYHPILYNNTFYKLSIPPFLLFNITGLLTHLNATSPRLADKPPIIVVIRLFPMPAPSAAVVGISIVDWV